MPEAVDLELGLRRRDAERYALELRATLPGSESELRPLRDRPVAVAFDRPRLRALELDPPAYGRALAGMLLADPAAATAFAQLRAAAQSQGAALRLRLAIAPDAAELQDLAWEALRDPQDDQALGCGEPVWLSRYLAGADWQPIRRRARSDLRALVAIAAPSDLATFGLAPIDAAHERALALAGLQPLPATVLAGAARPTLAAILAQLRDGPDLLYLVAHGAMVEGEPWLWLEDAAGQAARVSGAELAARVAELAQRPRLALLVSCASAGASADALAALGPRLAEAGIPAVLAMRGALSVETARRFLATFTAELRRDGQKDSAMAIDQTKQTRYCSSVRRLIEHAAQRIRPSHGDVESLAPVDERQGSCMLLYVGWSGNVRHAGQRRAPWCCVIS